MALHVFEVQKFPANYAIKDRAAKESHFLENNRWQLAYQFPRKSNLKNFSSVAVGA